MSLRDIIKLIKDAALHYPNVNSVYEGDIYELNTDQSVDYASVVITQGEHQVNTLDEEITYNFYIFYVDRQTSNGDNITMVQSHGINIVSAILTRLGEVANVENYTIHTFKERFGSLCAGAYAEAGITVHLDTCADYMPPTPEPTPEPPTPEPTEEPTEEPTDEPTPTPTPEPTDEPTDEPTPTPEP